MINFFKNLETKDVFFLISIRIFSYFKRFFISLQKYLIKDFFNLVVLSSLILLFITIVTWLQIITADGDGKYDIEKVINSTDQSLFYYFEIQAARFDFYRQIQSFTIFSLFLQTLKYLYFSKRASLVLDTFSHAKSDLFFYIFMFSIILLAFSAMGFIAFGIPRGGFSVFSKAITNCLIILVGKIDLHDLLEANSFMGPFFYFSFCVISIF